MLNVGFPIDQAVIDAHFIMSLFFLPMFFYEYHNEIYPYSVKEISYSVIAIILVNIGVILLSEAIKYGHAGACQAIENSKTIWHTLMVCIFLGQIPNLLEWLGLASGFIGVLIIVL